MSRATQEYKQELSLFHIRGHYPLGRCFPAASVIKTFCNSSRTSTTFASYNPAIRRQRFGLVPFRSPLLRVSRELRSMPPKHRPHRTQLILFSFPPGTEMFHFPGFASRRRYSTDFQFKTERVSPFGDLRIKGYKPPPRSFSQVSRVLHSRPRPRHPPCTLTSLVRNFVYHNHFLQSDTSQPQSREDFNYLCIFVCQRVRASRNERTAPHGAVRKVRTRGLTAFPHEAKVFRIRRHVERV